MSFNKKHMQQVGLEMLFSKKWYDKKIKKENPSFVFISFLIKKLWKELL